MHAAGNTEVTTLSFAEALSVKSGRWEFKDLGSVVYGRSGDSTTAEQIKVDARVEVQVVSVLHVFVGGIYERNHFAGFDRRPRSESALVAPVAGRAAIKVAYVVRYDKLPEPGVKKTDRTFTTALQIVF